MTYDDLFEELDLKGDGRLSREELYQAACLFGWRRPQAPLFALLDFLTIRTPLDRDAFIACLTEVEQDSRGVYGRVLRRGPLPPESPRAAESDSVSRPGPVVRVAPSREGIGPEGFISLPGNPAGIAASGFALTMEGLDPAPIRVGADQAALLVIDPQISFTTGEWMQSLGPSAEKEVRPIRQAFDNCARLLEVLYRRLNVMFTRCPFPPQSFGWDRAVDAVIDPGQIYFIKPGNNVLALPDNGCREWVEGLIAGGVRTLVLGGCTLNSCLRVSAIALRNSFRPRELDIVVDLSLCGARSANYLPSPLFGGMSPVESAIRQMIEAGVRVSERLEWRPRV